MCLHRICGFESFQDNGKCLVHRDAAHCPLVPLFVTNFVILGWAGVRLTARPEMKQMDYF
jgi:hypothetical protein